MADYEFRFYVTSDDDSIVELAEEIQRVLAENFENHHFETVNLLENGNADLAMSDGVFSVPALVKRSPSPPEQWVGDLSDTSKLMLLIEKTKAPGQ